jgi:hypothetical protein
VIHIKLIELGVVMEIVESVEECMMHFVMFLIQILLLTHKVEVRIMFHLVIE